MVPGPRLRAYPGTGERSQLLPLGQGSRKQEAGKARILVSYLG